MGHVSDALQVLDIRKKSDIITQHCLGASGHAQSERLTNDMNRTVDENGEMVFRRKPDAGTKLTVKAANKATKKAVKSKQITIKAGVKAKLVFTNKVKKGTYKFKVTSAAGEGYSKTSKTFTIKVK